MQEMGEWMSEQECAMDSLGLDSFMGDGFDDCDFDPLAADDIDLDEDEIDEDNPYDTVDYPVVREMPQHMRREAVFTPSVQGSAEDAIRSLIDHNPARRGVLLEIVDLCRNGCTSSVVSARVGEIQKDNRSVYAPMTLCRMLERAGALELTLPETTTEKEDVAEGVEYLEIKEEIDPVWTATPAGLLILDELSQGAEFREIVLDHDEKYLPVYDAVLNLLTSGPRQRQEIEAVVDGFDLVKSPRRFGGHFIDMLERTNAIAWKGGAWTLTDLGATLYEELKEKVN